ncbi:MAG: hypothetical protein WBC71_05340 [Salaquimonas sp.]
MSKKTDAIIPATNGKIPFALKLVGSLAVVGLVIFVAVIAMKLTTDKEAQPVPQTTSLQEEDTSPISILPLEPGGVTILQKQPETNEPLAPIALAPIAQGADVATGFGIDVGSADSFLDLTRKFAELVTINGPENFQRLEPRAILRETLTGLEARLLIGPFETAVQAVEACNVLILSDEIPCTAEIFQGELIARE